MMTSFKLLFFFGYFTTHWQFLSILCFFLVFFSITHSLSPCIEKPSRKDNKHSNKSLIIQLEKRVREWKDLCKGHRFSLHATTVPWPAIPSRSVNLGEKKGKRFLEAAKDVESEAQALALLMSEVKNGFFFADFEGEKLNFTRMSFTRLLVWGFWLSNEITFQQFSRAQARVAKHTRIQFSVSSKRSMLSIVAQSFDTVQSIIIFQYRTINYRSIRESEKSHSSPIFINFLLISSRKTFIFNLFLLVCFSSVLLLPLDSAFAMYLPSTLLFTVGLGRRSLVDSLIRPETSLIFHRALPISLQIRQQTPKAFVESWVYIFTILQLFSLLFTMETSGERCDILLRAKLVPND